MRCAKLQSNCHHQQTTAHLFTDWTPFLSANQQCHSTGEYHISQACSRQHPVTPLTPVSRSDGWEQESNHDSPNGNQLNHRATALWTTTVKPFNLAALEICKLERSLTRFFSDSTSENIAFNFTIFVHILNWTACEHKHSYISELQRDGVWEPWDSTGHGSPVCRKP